MIEFSFLKAGNRASDTALLSSVNMHFIVLHSAKKESSVSAAAVPVVTIQVILGG